MKYGETFQAQSVPQWAPYNVDYNELKNLIKVNTTKDQSQAIAIPGQADTALQKFEDLFFNELSNQHDRVDLFVKSKADEISRRLANLESLSLKLIAKCTYSNDKPISQRKRERFAKYDSLITRCGEDINLLQRFVDAQRMAFHKILKKYKKWTGSRSLSERFHNEILSDPKSFTKRDFEPLTNQYNDLLLTLRAGTPEITVSPSPKISSRQESVQVPVQTAPQAYWNEYDDGSDAENEPYTIYINPDAEATYPGAKTVKFFVSKAKLPMEKVRAWFSPSSSPGERRPLIRNGNSYGYFTEQTETDVDEEAYASSIDFPAGYAAHYATLPSVSDQRLSRHREKLLFQGTIVSFTAAFALMVVAGILVATGKHKLRIEVDAGAIVGVVGSLFFGSLGLGTVLYCQERLSWLHRICVGVTFTTVCFLNGMLLVTVVGNSGA